MKNKKNNDLYIWSFLVLLVALVASFVPASLSFTDTSDGPKEEEENEEITEIFEQFGFIGDLHFLSEEEIGDDDYASFQAYRYTGERIIPLSEAILKTAVDRYIEQRVTAVFVCGDLTETGSKESLQKVADELQRLKDAGIKVYVCNGTADIQDIDLTTIVEENTELLFTHRFNLEESCYTPYRFTATGKEAVEKVNEEGFREIFSDFGFSEAISTDDNSLSYVCDVTDTVRLVNYSLPYYYVRIPGYPHRMYNYPVVTDDSLCWLESVLRQAQEEQKEVVMMSYFPLSNDIYRNIGDISYKFSVRLQDCDLVQDLCAQYGVRFVISGNAHFASESTFCDLDGNPVCTNITCPSLTNYPLPLYTLYFGKNWSYSYESIQTIDEKYLPSYYTEEEKKEITSDLQGYSVRYMEKEIRKKIDRFFDSMRLYEAEDAYFMHIVCYVLHLYEHERDSIPLLKELRSKAFEILDMPLYGENSMDSCLQKYGLSMPESDYTSLLNLVVRNFCDIYIGKYDNAEGSLNRELFRSVGYAVLDMAADYGVFYRIHELQESVEAYDTHEITKRVIEKGYVDIRWDDLIIRFVSIIEPYVSANTVFNISGIDTPTVLTLVDLILGAGLKLAFPWTYEEDEGYGSIFGVKISKYLDTKEHTLDVKKMCEELFFDLIVRDMLN